MANRNLLHISKLEEFKAWLDRQGYVHRPGRGEYEVVQVQVKAPDWYCIYRRLSMPEHYTVDSRMIYVVQRFIFQNRLTQDPPITYQEAMAPCPDDPPWPT